MSAAPPADSGPLLRRPALVIIALVQAAAAAFILSDAVRDVLEFKAGAVSVFEFLLATGLVFGVIHVAREAILANRRIERQARALAVASGALSDVIETQFARWQLTGAEREVALLALKGLDNARIAELRGAAPGTVRAQMTSVYHKAGVTSRAQFAAWFVEDLLQDGVVPAESRGAA